MLIRRLPEGRPVLWSRSACETCHGRLGPVELLPIASYLLQGFKCRRCGTRIAPAHVWIELAAILVPVSGIVAGDGGVVLFAGAVLGWMLLAVSWIDWEHMRLPDALTLPLIPMGLAATWLLAPDGLAAHAFGAALGYLAFRGVALAYRRLRGRDGLGHGDAKLLAGGGAWLGPEALSGIIFAGAVCGITLCLLAWLRGARLRADTAIPFGPCLAAGIWLLWLWGR